MSDPGATAGEAIRGYLLGYALALVLTGLAFASVYFHAFSRDKTLAAVFALGLIQMIVHFRFFLHIDLKKSAREDLQLILFSSLIVALMVGGTLVILMNLRYRMM